MGFWACGKIDHSKNDCPNLDKCYTRIAAKKEAITRELKPKNRQKYNDEAPLGVGLSQANNYDSDEEFCFLVNIKK